jgi:drug/metabolite transporter (DMT)-like permease
VHRRFALAGVGAGVEEARAVNPTTDEGRRRRALLLLSFLALVWGTNWPLFPIAVREFSVWTFRTFSIGIAIVTLAIIMRLRGDSFVLPRRVWPAAVAVGLVYLVIWNTATTFAALWIPSGHAAVLGYTMPLWAALISVAIYRERFTGRLLAAIAAGALAVALLMREDFAAFARAPQGLLLGLAAGVAWAVGTHVQKRTDWGAGQFAVTFWQIVICWVPIAVVACIVGDRQLFVPSTLTIGLVVYISVVPMALGYTAWNLIVGLLPAQVAALASVAVPVVAMSVGAAIGSEPFGPIHALAMGLAALSVYLALVRR